MVPVAYSYRNLLVRWKTTLMTAAGFTLVVAVLIVMLAFVNGVRTVCAVTGQPENVICLNKGNTETPLDVSHNQEKGKPGYTAEGHRAALATMISYNPDPAAVISNG